MALEPVITNHPLIQHKITHMRKTDTTCKEFRELVEEITTLMTYECLKEGVPTVEKEVKTPLEVCTQRVVKDNTIVIVPILGIFFHKKVYNRRRICYTDHIL